MVHGDEGVATFGGRVTYIQVWLRKSCSIGSAPWLTKVPTVGDAGRENTDIAIRGTQANCRHCNMGLNSNTGRQ